MFNKESTGLVAYFFRAYPKRTLIMVLCLIFAGLTAPVNYKICLALQTGARRKVLKGFPCCSEFESNKNTGEKDCFKRGSV